MKINRKLLIFKAHYFLINGAMSGVIPILPVYGKELGISAFAIGVIHTFLKLLTVAAKVLCGAVADKFKKYKLILMVCLAIIVVSTLGLSFTPRPIDENHTNSSGIEIPYNCLEMENCTSIERNTTREKTPGDGRSLQFWLFTVLVTITWLAYTIADSLSDAATYNVLQRDSHRFGNQRMFGSIGWGLFAALAGYFNDMFSDVSNNYYSYLPGFYILVILLIVDEAVVYRLNLNDAKLSKSIFKDVGKLIVKPRIFLFLLSVLVNGAFIGFNWSYQFMYLRSLKADQLLLGIISTLQCCAEIPFFMFSGWIIIKIGQINTILLAIVSFGLRFIGYAYLVDPWWSLPLELFHGPAFASFYSAITSYATVVAPEGTEATMQGLVGGTMEGFGFATGSLLGGVGFDWLGGRRTFFVAAVLATISAVLHSVSYRVLDFLETRKASRTKREDTMDLSNEQIARFL